MEKNKLSVIGVIITLFGVVFTLIWLFIAVQQDDEWLKFNILAISIPIILVNLGINCWVISEIIFILDKLHKSLSEEYSPSVIATPSKGASSTGIQDSITLEPDGTMPKPAAGSAKTPSASPEG